MDKILRIDVGAAGGPKATTTPRWATMQGSAAGIDIGRSSRRSTAAVPSSGAENKLVMCPGLLSDRRRQSGRISVAARVRSRGASRNRTPEDQASQVLAKLGFGAIVLEGKPASDDLYKVFINKDGIKITKEQTAFEDAPPTTNWSKR